MQWYYSKSNTQLGPVTEDELRAKLSSGEVSQADLIWKEGMADWLPASRVPEFSSRTVPPAMMSPVVSSLENVSSSPYTSPVAPSYPSPAMMGAAVPNYLWQSIVVTLFCCLPFGIVAIVYAAKVDSLRASGDFHGASAASASAKTWCLVSLASAAIPVVLWLIFAIFGMIMAGAQGGFPH